MSLCQITLQLDTLWKYGGRENQNINCIADPSAIETWRYIWDHKDSNGDDRFMDVGILGVMLTVHKLFDINYNV